MKLPWMAHSRPDLLVDISQLAQITEQYFTDYQRATIKRLNTAIKYSNNNSAQMTYPKLDVDTLRIIGYSDAALPTMQTLHRCL